MGTFCPSTDHDPAKTGLPIKTGRNQTHTLTVRTGRHRRKTRARNEIIDAIACLVLVFLAGTISAPRSHTPQASAAQLPMLSSPEELFAWCQTHNTAALRAQLSPEGRAWIRGCDNIGDVI